MQATDWWSKARSKKIILSCRERRFYVSYDRVLSIYYHLHQALTNLDSWSRDNIKFNASKCKVVTVTRKKSPVDFVYTILALRYCGASIKKNICVLSFQIICLGTSCIYIQGIVTKANKLLGLLKRTCPLLQGTKVRRTLYLFTVKSPLTRSSKRRSKGSRDKPQIGF